MSEPVSDPKPKFRLNSKNLSLTFPRCHAMKEAVMTKLLTMYPSQIQYAIICQEHHVDGDLHLHLMIQGITKFDIKNATHLDQLTGQHGNYQVGEY